MKKALFLIVFFVVAKLTGAQKIDSIYFHLYTDSLKKGFYNYINIDAKTADGKWMPLSAKEISFSAGEDSTLFFKNNDLFIDSSYGKETVTVKAVLRQNPQVWKEITIYIRKRGFNEPLPTNEQILQQGRNRRNNWRYSLIN